MSDETPVELLKDRLLVQGRAGLHELLGREFVLDRWHVITQEAIDAFCLGTGEPRSENQLEVPGFLTLGLVIQQFHTTFDLRGFTGLLNYGVNRMRLPHPLEVGTPVRARFKFVDVKDVPLAVDVTMQITIESKGGDKPVCWVEWIARGYEVRTRPGTGCDT